MMFFEHLYPAPDWLSQRAQWPHSHCSHFIKTPRMNWHVQIMGRGPVALLLHGTGASTHTWREVAPLLAPHYTLVCPDLPGHGFSSALQGGEPSIRSVYEELASLLKSLERKPQLLIGHSAGAAVAAQWCLSHPLSPGDGLPALIALNPAWLPLPGLAQWLFPVTAWMAAFNPLSGVMVSHQARRNGAVERLMATTGSRLDEKGLACYRYLLSQAAHVRGILQLMAAWNVKDVADRLHEVKNPVLVQVGQRDLTVPAHLGRRASDVLPQATLSELPGLGHLAHEEAPAKSVESWLAWLKTLGAAGSTPAAR
jgi:magnesium chelatase accessory protein